MQPRAEGGAFENSMDNLFGQVVLIVNAVLPSSLEHQLRHATGSLAASVFIWLSGGPRNGINRFRAFRNALRAFRSALERPRRPIHPRNPPILRGSELSRPDFVPIPASF